jgi:hypothetical protein
VIFGNGGSGVPRLFFVSPDTSYGTACANNTPRSDNEQSLALLDQPVLRQILNLVAHVVTGAADVVEEHEEVGIMLLVRQETKSLFKGGNPRLDFLEDGSDRVYRLEIGLVIGSFACTILRQL